MLFPSTLTDEEWFKTCSAESGSDGTSEGSDENSQSVSAMLLINLFCWVATLFMGSGWTRNLC
jgi:hypothetical protein